MTVRLRFPIQSKFQFRDQKGNLYTLESPELQQYLLQLANRTGGTATDLVADSQSRLGSVESEITTLEQAVEELEELIVLLQKRLKTTISMLELRQNALEEKLETD